MHGKQNIKKGQSMCVRPNIEVRSCNHYCSGNSMSVTQAVWVFVTLVIQNAKHMHHIFIYGLPRSTVFFNLMS